jgi:hypothetical protein
MNPEVCLINRFQIVSDLYRIVVGRHQYGVKVGVEVNSFYDYRRAQLNLTD